MSDEETGSAEKAEPPRGRKKRGTSTIELNQSEYSASAAPDPAAAPPDEAAEVAQNSAAGSSPAQDAAPDASEATTAGGARRRAPLRGGVAAMGAAAGGIAGLFFAAALWASGLFSPPATSPALDDLTGRLARLEQSAAAAKTETPAPDAVLRARVSALEQSAQSARETLTTLRRQFETLSSAVSEVKATQGEPKKAAENASAAPPSEPARSEPADAALAALRMRIDEMDGALRALDAKLKEQAEQPKELATNAPVTSLDIAGDARLRRLALAFLLDARMRDGVSYRAEFDEVKAVNASPPLDAGALAALDAFADRGLPSARDLAGDLRQNLNAAMAGPVAEKKSQPPTAPLPASSDASGMIERLSAHAAKLVKIERAESQPSPPRAMAAEPLLDAAARGDLAAVMRARETLNDQQKAALDAWAERFKARQAARDAVQVVLQGSAAPFRATSSTKAP